MIQLTFNNPQKPQETLLYEYTIGKVLKFLDDALFYTAATEESESATCTRPQYDAINPALPVLLFLKRVAHSRERPVVLALWNTLLTEDRLATMPEKIRRYIQAQEKIQ